MYIWSTIQLDTPPNLEDIALQSTDTLFDSSIYQTRRADFWQNQVPEYTQRTGIQLARYVRHQLPDCHKSWILQQVPELQHIEADWGYQIIDNDQQHNQGVIMTPHTDGDARGNHVLQYLIDSGGSQVKTSWWQEDHKPLVREKIVTLNDDKTLVAETEFVAGSWSIFRTDILHGVGIITTARRAITVGFNNERLFYQIIRRLGIVSFSLKNYDLVINK
jgi:hypothetical protein